MMVSLNSRLLRVRHWLVPDELGHGWTPLAGLGYLVFLFLPVLFGGGEMFGRAPWRLWLTLASVLLFLPLYFACYRSRGGPPLAYILGIAAVGFVLLPANPFANTYALYAISLLALRHTPLARRLGWGGAVLAGFAVEVHLLGYPAFVTALTAVLAVIVFFGNHYYAESARKRAELERSHDEVRRLAALAERERIGRDLHDLLGHTLSMVALKSELAGKLLSRDPAAARREIEEVSAVAREALSQVRRAVTGIRSAGLAAELAAARLLLECEGITLRSKVAEAALDPAQETVLALVLREAVTNIQRHSAAGNVEVALRVDGADAVLRVADDGRGGEPRAGNGIVGMRERLEAAGGTLHIAAAARGLALEARVPLAAPAAAPAAAATAPAPQCP